ncbi:hypothetical protein V4C56_06240 [Paraburkholderia azotifigens]|uniref:Uncharacterized protein n=1 Tax=Paraburkholderia azotifigens TaxID=2057004 RepID=A0ABU9QWR2_9BURK
MKGLEQPSTELTFERRKNLAEERRAQTNKHCAEFIPSKGVNFFARDSSPV